MYRVLQIFKAKYYSIFFSRYAVMQKMCTLLSFFLEIVKINYYLKLFDLLCHTASLVLQFSSVNLRCYAKRSRFFIIHHNFN